MSKPKFHIAIKNATEPNTLELHFLDYIYDGFDWNTFTEINMVADTINKVKSANPSKIKLLIDSQGGDAGIGLAIYNFLTSYNAKVETDIVGMAGSIASVIAMAANAGKLKMARNSFMVIHKAWGVGVGNSDELRAAADIIDKYTGQVVDVYSQRTGKTVDEINNLIDGGDFWMTAQEAVELGFADELYNDNSQFQIAARVKDLSNNYKNIPQNLINANVDENEAKETPQTFFSTIKNEFMKIVNDLKAAFAGLKKPEDASGYDAAQNSLIEKIENAVTPSIKAIEDRIEEVAVSNETVTGLQTSNNDLTTQLKEANDSIKKLQDDVANLIGGEAKPKTEVKDEVQSVGKFS